MLIKLNKIDCKGVKPLDEHSYTPSLNFLGLPPCNFELWIVKHDLTNLELIVNHHLLPIDDWQKNAALSEESQFYLILVGAWLFQSLFE